MECWNGILKLINRIGIILASAGWIRNCLREQSLDVLGQVLVRE